MYFILITWLLYQMTGDPIYTGLFVSLGFVPGFLLNLLFGVIVDRFDRKGLAIIANSLAFITTLAVCFFMDNLHPWFLIGVHMILQTSGSLLRPAIQAFIAEVFKQDDLPTIISQTGAAAITGALLGAGFGGVLNSFLPPSLSMVFITLCFLLATLSIVFVRRLERKITSPEKQEFSVFKDLSEGFQYLRNHSYLLSLFGVMFVGQLVFHTSIGFMSVYTIDFLQRPISIYGWLDAALSLGGLTAGLLGGWLWRKTRYFATSSLVIVFMGLVMMGGSTSLYTTFAAVFCIGLGTTWIRILLQSTQQILTDSRYHGRMASYRMICNQGSVIISGPIFGLVATHFGVQYIYFSLLFPVSFGLMVAFYLPGKKWFREVTHRTIV